MTLDVDWDRWHELLAIRDSEHMTWVLGEEAEYDTYCAIVKKLDKQEERVAERHLYKRGNSISLRMRREAGVCKWGHTDYVKGGYGKKGNQDWSGDNVKIRRYPSGRIDVYCAACHRAQVLRKQSDAAAANVV